MNNEKVMKLVEKMLAESDKIKSVSLSDSEFSNVTNEYYFTFPDNKYKWSISQIKDGSFYLFYYKDSDDDSSFLRVGDNLNDDFFDSNLKNLHELLKGKESGLEIVLQDILNN